MNNIKNKFLRNLSLFFTLLIALPVHAAISENGGGDDVASSFKEQLSAEEIMWLAEHPKIRIGTMESWIPFNFVDSHGTPSGIGADYIEAINRRLGGVLEIVPGIWKKIYDDVKEQRLDALMDISPKPSREPYFNFTSPYLDIPHILISRDEMGAPQSEDDLSGKTVALERGFGNVKWFQKYHPEVQVKEYDDTRQALGAVARGEVDVYAGNRTVALYLMEQEVITNLKARDRLKKSGSILAIGTRKDWPVLRDILQKVLADISIVEKRNIIGKWVQIEQRSAKIVRLDKEILLDEDELQWIAQNPVIRVANEDDWPPYDFSKQGVARGYSIELMKLVASNAGLDIEFVNGYTWNELLQFGRERKVDVFPVIWKTPEREEFLDYTEPYATSKHVLVIQQREMGISSINDLRGRTLAGGKEYADIEIVKEHFPDIDVREYKSIEQGLRAVAFGEVDAYLGTLGAISYALKEEMLSGLKIATETDLDGHLEAGKMHIAVRSDQPLLMGIMQKGLDAVSEKEIETLRHQWFQEVDKSSPVDGVDDAFDEIWWSVISTVALFTSILLVVLLFPQIIPEGIYERYLRSKYFRLFLLLAVSIALILSMVVISITLEETRKQGLSKVHFDLTTILHSTMDRVEIWVDKRKMLVAEIADDPVLRQIVEELAEVSHKPELSEQSEALEVAAKFFTALESRLGSSEFLILDSEGLTLASSDRADLGMQSTMAVETPDLLARVFNGETVLIPLHSKNVEEVEGHIGGVETVMVVSPIVDDRGVIRTVLAQPLFADRSISNIMQRGIIGKTGESYLVSSAGRFLSESRFSGLLEHYGLTSGEWKDLSGVEIRNPGIDLTNLDMWNQDRSLPNLKRGEPTRMASEMARISHIHGEKQSEQQKLNDISELSRYSNYLGVPVYGVWIWNGQHGFGIATEIRASEADGPYLKLRRNLIISLGLILLMAITLIMLSVKLGERAAKEMRRTQRELEQLISERTESLQQAQAISHMGNWEWDIVSNGLIWSDEVYRIFGWEPQSFAPDFERFMAMVHPDDREQLQAVIDNVIIDPDSEYQNQHRLVRDDGSERYVQESGRVTCDESGNPLKMHGTIIDITMLVKTQEDLELYRLMIENSADPIFMIDNEDGFKLAYVNDAATKHYGASKEELLTWSIPDWDPHFTEADLPAHLEMIKANADTDKTLTIETEHRIKSGEIVPVELSLNLITYKGHLCHFGYIHNITQRKETEQKLLDAKEQAENAAQLKSQFLANMSHEIRTPMNAVINLSKLALQTELTAQQRNYIEKVERSGSNLLGIINDILDFSKIEADKLTIEHIPFSLDDVLHNVSDVVTQQARNKGLELLYDLNFNLPDKLLGDPLRISQILINLINNAVKFTEQGEIVFSIRDIEHSDNKVSFEFKVRDSGIGMTDEQQERLFKAFHQADGSITRKYGGTGLGLSISKRLIELMDGELSVESELNKGSTFSFTLELPVVEESHVDRIDFSGLGEKRIMIVDDNDSARELMKDLLKQFKITPVVAASAPQALQILKNSETEDNPIELMFVDWKMPEMDGIEFMQQVMANQAIAPKPRSILVSGFATDELSHAAEQAGFSDVLHKPFTPSTFFDLIVQGGGGRPTYHKHPDARDTQEALLKIRGAQVLVVEDNEINQLIAEELLNVIGLNVSIAENGLKALEVMDKTEFDLVLMDLQMPEMDGYEATQEIRKNSKFKETPIVAMTAHAMSDEAEKCLKIGMNDHLAKPIEIEKLDAALIRWIKPGDRVSSVRDDQIAVDSEMPDSLPGIDLKRGLNLVGGNKKLYLEILNRFRESQKNTVRDMEEAIAGGRRDDAKITFHSIKGTAGNIGALKLSDCAAQLENIFASNSDDNLQSRFDDFTVALDEIMSSLSRFSAIEKVESIDEVELQNIDTEAVGLMINNMTSQLESDLPTAKKIFEELYSQLLPTRLRDDVERLKYSLSEYDTDGAMTILQDILPKLDGD